jgi:hypothetical protein
VLLSTPSDGPVTMIHADAYDVGTNAWTALPDLRLPVNHEAIGFDAVVVGGALAVWSEWSHSTPDTGSSISVQAGIDPYVLDLDAGKWDSVAWAPDKGKGVGQPIWTGHQILFAGEDIYCGACSHPVTLDKPILAIDPRTGSRTHAAPGPLNGGTGQYVWTGAALLMINGSEIGGSVRPGDSAAYDPSSDTWIRVPSAPAVDVYEPVTLWTGSLLLVWGALPQGSGGVTSTGGIEFAPR